MTPYGLRRVPVILESGGVKKKYEPDPPQAAIVRRIYQEYAEGNGLYTIARGLNRDGIRTKTGKDWEQTSIHHILFKNRPYYQGRMIFNRTKTLIKKRVSNKPEDEWIIVDGAHEAIIDPELAERVDRRRRDVPRPNFQKGSDGTHNLLNGLILRRFSRELQNFSRLRTFLILCTIYKTFGASQEIKYVCVFTAL